MPEGTQQAAATLYQAETKYEGTVVSGFLGRSKNTNEPIITITVAGPHGEIDWEKVVTAPSATSKGTIGSILKTFQDIWGVNGEQWATKRLIIPFLTEHVVGKRVSFVTEWTQASDTAPKVMMIKYLNPLRFRRPADEETLDRFESIAGGSENTRPTAPPPQQPPAPSGDPWGLSDADVPPPSQKYRS